MENITIAEPAPGSILQWLDPTEEKQKYFEDLIFYSAVGSMGISFGIGIGNVLLAFQLFFLLSPFGLEKVPFIKPQNSPASLSPGSLRRASSRRAGGIASPSYNPQIEDALYQMEGRSSASLDRKKSSLEKSSSKRTSADRDPFTGKLRRVESARTPPMETSVAVAQS